MSKIIEIQELGFPKCHILRENQETSELIDSMELEIVLNEQIKKENRLLRDYKTIIKDLEDEIESLKKQICLYGVQRHSGTVK